MTLLTLPLKVDLTHVHLSDEQFYQLCLDNPNLVIERDRYRLNSLARLFCPDLFYS